MSGLVDTPGKSCNLISLTEIPPMPVPISQMWTVASYVIGQKLKGNKHYPLVLMLEPLFRCNLSCAGCGKIQYPDHILHKLPLLKAQFTQIQAPKYPHLVDQLEFLADAVEDFAEEAYKDLPYVAFAGAVFALIYCHRVHDLIPNFEGIPSYADDSTIVRTILTDHEKAFTNYAKSLGISWSKITKKP